MIITTERIAEFRKMGYGCLRGMMYGQDLVDELLDALTESSADLERVKRNHLRRMGNQNMDARRRAHYYAIQRGARWPDDRIRAINRRFNRFFEALYTALAKMEEA